MQFYIHTVAVHCSQQMGEASSRQDHATWVLEAECGDEALDYV